MGNDVHSKTVKGLTLILLYLTSWQEKNFPENLRRSWKNHNFNTLDTLVEDGLIDSSNRAKSIYLLEDGINEARELLKKYGIDIEHK